MKICIVARGLKIPVTNYGGTERVIWGLAKELHQKGHNITFLVPPGSRSDFAEVIPIEEDKDLNDQIPDKIDLVHLNFTPDTPIEKPHIVTIHGNPRPEESLDINTVFVSRNHAKRYNSDAYVHNGLVWDEYPEPDLQKHRTGYHFLGKARWSVKNAAGAMKIAQKNNAELGIIGGKKWTERNLKSSFIHLFNPKIKFHGFLDDDQKMRVMENSKGLIFPVLWHEPFGLAIIESLYAGCAVFGSELGSLQELVTSEVGFTSNSIKELSRTIKDFEYDPVKCHEYAVNKFNSRRMAEDYLRLYAQVLEGKPLNKTAPQYNPELNRIPARIFE